MNNIDSNHMAKIAESLELNDKIIYFYYKQYGQEIKQQVITNIDTKLAFNCKKFESDTKIVPNNEYQRMLKHSYKVKNIDSIYRNNCA